MSDDPARARFFIIQTARIAGVVITLLGMLAWRGDLIQPGGAPLIGGVLIVLGLAEMALVPRMLVRRWRTPVPDDVERPR